MALVGPCGGGKTTTLAKLAANFKLRQKRSVAILSLDMHRLAAHEQLRRYGEILAIPIHTAQSVTEVKDALRASQSPDVLLIDTPGVGLRDQGRFARLASLLRAAGADETHLVLPAAWLPNLQRRVADTFAPLGVSRVVLTHLDDAVGFGVVLNTLEQIPWNISYLSGGQRVPHDIEEACIERLSQLILSPEG